MKTLHEIGEDLKILKMEIRDKIKQYSFDSFKPGNYYKIHFTDNEGIFDKEMAIDEIVYEGSNVGIYPRSKKFMSHSENTIEDIHDLMLICSLIEEHIDSDIDLAIENMEDDRYEPESYFEE